MDRLCRDCIVAGIASTNAVSTYDHSSSEFESHPCRIALDAILCDTNIFFPICNDVAIG